MKTKINLSAFLLCISLASQAAIDLVPGINYSYNLPGSNGIITSIDIDACNNGSTAASAFDVSIYLYDPNTTNYWIIGTTTLTNGLSGNACININNWDIDINNTSAVPAGTGYRIGIWVDSGSAISESDESNNAGLMSGSFSYSPSVGITKNTLPVVSFGNCYPSPSAGVTTLRFTTHVRGEASVKVFDIFGKQVAVVSDGALEAGEHALSFDCSALAAGMYVVAVTCNGASTTGRLVVSR